MGNITLHAIKFKDLKMGESFKHYNGSDIVVCIKTGEFSFIENVSKKAHYIDSMNDRLVYKNDELEPEKEEDPRDNPLIGEDDWIHDIDMGAR